MNLKVVTVSKDQLKPGLLMVRRDEGLPLTIIGTFRRWFDYFDSNWQTQTSTEMFVIYNLAREGEEVVYALPPELTILVDTDEKDPDSPLYYRQVRGEWVSIVDSTRTVVRGLRAFHVPDERDVPTIHIAHDNTPKIGVAYQFFDWSPIPAVLERQQLFKDQWQDLSDSYWMANFMKSIGQLSAALAEGDEMLTDLELRDIGSICLNWLVKRSES